MRGTAAHSFLKRLLGMRSLALLSLAGAVAVGVTFLTGDPAPGPAQGAGAPLPAVVLHPDAAGAK
ncbi:MAG TPA: hypothetical protein VFJ75_09405, partial [Gaiellaceae bacterium]|nr:hypothetical protein [Gaiellaceae bacterium]